MTRFQLNGNPVDVDAPACLCDVIAMLVPEGSTVAVARNGEVVPRSQWSDVTVNDGDRLEILAPAQGG